MRCPRSRCEVLDVVEGLGDAQAVQCQQRGQGVVPRRAEAGLDEEGTELVAVQAKSAGLVVDLRSAHVESRVAIDQLLLFAVAVEATVDPRPFRRLTVRLIWNRRASVRPSPPRMAPVA